MTTKAARKPAYRVRFVIDEDARFEECNGEARPLTEEEYAENVYRCCPDHPRAGTKVVQWEPKQIQGCNLCERTDYRDVTYDEYRAYYGDPDRHVYVRSEVEQQCPCCNSWDYVTGLGSIDLMDDSPELRNLDEWYEEDQLDQVVGYLGEIAREGIQEARDEYEEGQK